MTTTAEKINFVLRQLEKTSKNKSDYADKILEFFCLGHEHRFSIFTFVHKKMDIVGYIAKHMKEDIKPTDPEPLELWINVYGSGLKAGYESEDQAKKHEMLECLRLAVHMREVTS